MGRRAEGWKLYLDERTKIYGVRWRRDGVRQHVSTGTRDPDEAARTAATIYAASVSGRRRTRSRTGKHEIETLGSEWLVDSDQSIDPETNSKYEQYVAAWATFFVTLNRVTGPSIEDFWRARLREVKRRTVIKQLYALNGFLRWCRSRQLLEEIPRYDMPPKSATGTPAKGRTAVETVPLSAPEVEALLAKLPEWSAKKQKNGKRWRVRDRFVIAWETALRPATLDGIMAPGDYKQGGKALRIRDEIDKARFGREVPLSARAREALDRCAPQVGRVLGRVDSHTACAYLRAAAAASTLPTDKAQHVKPYDLRHARLTLLAESGNLVGVAYLAGHKAITTTNRYVHSHARAAVAVLEFGTEFGTEREGKERRKRGGKKRVSRR
jgi:integrase